MDHATADRTDPRPGPGDPIRVDRGDGIALDVQWSRRRPAPGEPARLIPEPSPGSLATGGYPGVPLLCWPCTERGRGLLAWYRSGHHSINA